jgi:hypothetical protein
MFPKKTKSMKGKKSFDKVEKKFPDSKFPPKKSMLSKMKLK